MAKQANVYEVKDFKKINTTQYSNGDIFINERFVAGILLNGKVKPFNTSVNLSGYIKESELDSLLKKKYPELFKQKEG